MSQREIKSIDVPICPNCNGMITQDIPSFESHAVQELSGATAQIKCTYCNAKLNISPSIQWIVTKV